MNKYPFVYTVHIYDYDAEEYYLENGVGFCESFADAANILEKNYGANLIAVKHLKIYEFNNVITLPKGAFDEVVDCLESEECFEIKCDDKGVKIADTCI